MELDESRDALRAESRRMAGTAAIPLPHAPPSGPRIASQPFGVAHGTKPAPIRSEPLSAPLTGVLPMGAHVHGRFIFSKRRTEATLFF